MNDRFQRLINNADIVDIVGQDFDLVEAAHYAKGVVHDSLVIDKRKKRFYWNSIGVAGNAYDWLVQIKGLSSNEALKYLETHQVGGMDVVYEQPLGSPEIYQRLLDVFYNLGKSNRAYWYHRGYDDATIDRFKLGFTGRCYVVPVVLGGQLYNFQCRTPEKRIWAWSKTTGGLPFNFDAIGNSRSLIVTESPTNSIALAQYGFTSISQTSGAGSWRKWWSTYLLKVDELNIIYDNDEAGYHGAIKLAAMYRDRANVFVWPMNTPEKYDPNDWLKEKYTKPDIMSMLLERLLPYEVVKSRRSLLWNMQ